MEFIDVGQWGKAYRDELEGQAIARYKNAVGEDWYRKVAHNINRPKGFCVGLNATGIALFIADDLEQMNPSGLHVIVLPKFTDDPPQRRAVLGKRFDFDKKEFVDPPAAEPWFEGYASPHDAIRDLVKRVKKLEARHGRPV
jgi:hypothetical protein